MQALAKLAGVKTKLIGKGIKAVGGEAATRRLQKVPVAGMFVPETKLQKGQRVAGGTKDTLVGGRKSLADARKGRLPRKTIGATRKIKPPDKDKEITASLRQTYEDMVNLQKEAKHSAPGMGSVFSGALAHAGAGALMVGGLYGAGKLYKKMETERIWKRLKKENPELTKTPQDRENFEVLQRFSPDIAGNVTTARSYLQRAQQTYMAPHEFVKDLASVQDVRRKGGLGYQLEDVAKHSIGTGVDFASLQKKSSLNKAMDEVFYE